MAQYDRGDYVKVEFPADTPGFPGEYMWVRVHHCDEERQLVFGILDNEFIVNPEDLQLGQELAIVTARSANTESLGNFTRIERAAALFCDAIDQVLPPPGTIGEYKAKAVQCSRYGARWSSDESK